MAPYLGGLVGSEAEAAQAEDMPVAVGVREVRS